MKSWYTLGIDMISADRLFLLVTNHAFSSGSIQSGFELFRLLYATGRMVRLHSLQSGSELYATGGWVVRLHSIQSGSELYATGRAVHSLQSGSELFETGRGVQLHFIDAT